MPETEIGHVSDFFAKPVVAGITLTGTLKVGDTVHIKGHTTDIELTVESMQINNVNVTEGKAEDFFFESIYSLAIQRRNANLLALRP